MEHDQQLIPEAEHVLHLWQPLAFTVGEDYDYLRNKWYQRFGSALFRGLVTVILAVYNTLTLGMKVDGRKNLKLLKGQGAVAVCNHVHPMDCTMVDNALLSKRVYYVTLDTNFRIPVVRHIIRWLGAVPMSRSPKQIRTLFSQMGEAMAQGAVVQVYPEGVLIPYDSTLRSFRNGAFRLAVDSGVPVLPMVITQEPPKGIFRLYKRKPCLHLHILPPIRPDETLPRREAVAALHTACRAVMEDRLSQAKNCPTDSNNFSKNT